MCRRDGRRPYLSWFASSSEIPKTISRHQQDDSTGETYTPWNVSLVVPTKRQSPPALVDRIDSRMDFSASGSDVSKASSPSTEVDAYVSRANWTRGAAVASSLSLDMLEAAYDWRPVCRKVKSKLAGVL